MHYRFPYVGADLRKLVLQPVISVHCDTMDTGYRIVQYACLLLQLSLGTHSSLPTEGGLRLKLVKPVIWFHTPQGYAIADTVATFVFVYIWSSEKRSRNNLMHAELTSELRLTLN